MGKELSEMTLEELWDLFPVFLVRHDDRWKEYFKEAEDTIANLLTDYPVKRISHIGSTAIQGIWAKNIADVMVEISEKADMEEVARILEQNGFIRMSGEKGRISLNKGYTKEGFADKVYHIHLRYTGDNDELYFRDYLNEHPQVAKEYEALKLELWKKYAHNRDAYTAAKTDFVRKWTEKARKKYGDRYNLGTTAQCGGNGAAHQIFDLSRGSLAFWTKPGILWIPAGIKSTVGDAFEGCDKVVIDRAD